MTVLRDDDPNAWDPGHAWDHMSARQKRVFPTGGRLVVTPELRALARGLPSAVERNAIIVVSGPPGSGKSTAVAAISAIATVRTVAVEIAPRTRDKALWAEIAAATTGSRQDLSAHELRDRTRDYLTRNPALLVVDEAQNVGLHALLNLRWLIGLDIPGVALMLVGAGLDAYIEKEQQLASRVDRRILLTRQPPARMIEILRDYHPVISTMPVDLLTQIDEAYAHGSWRAWSKLVLTLVADMGVSTPSERDVRVAIKTITGKNPW